MLVSTSLRSKHLLLGLLRDPRPLRVPGVVYSERTEEELEIFQTGRSLLRSFGKQAIRHYIISHTETVSDLLEVLLLQKECGMMQGVLGDPDADRRFARRSLVRDNRRSSQCRHDHAVVL